MQRFTKNKQNVRRKSQQGCKWMATTGPQLRCVFRELNPAPYDRAYVLFGTKRLKRCVILDATCFNIKKFRVVPAEFMCSYDRFIFCC
jgi:hypothetical protein